MEYVSKSNGTIYWADADEPLTMGVSLLENGLVLKGIAIDMIQSYGDRLISYGLGYQTYQEERDFVMAAWNISCALSHDNSPQGPWNRQTRIRTTDKTLRVGSQIT